MGISQGRLSVSENITLFEYPTAKARDAALKKLIRARAVAERFLLIPKNLDNPDAVATVTTTHNYRAEPKRIIEFQNDEMERLKVKIAKDLGYELVDHRLELYGKKLKKGEK